MPTKKHRITITLEPEAYLAVVRYASATSASLSRAVASLLQQQAPYMSAVADALELAKRDPQAALASLERISNQVQQTAQEMAASLKSQADAD
jgi:hypothetical protein